MKNLATCKPTEFLKQSNRIKKSVEKWLTETDIMTIRKRMPDLINIEGGMTQDEIDKVQAENKSRIDKQARENLSEILDAIMDKHPNETLELLSLLCFVEPKNVDDHPMCEYLDAILEMITNDTVINFFSSLQRLGLTNMANA